MIIHLTDKVPIEINEHSWDTIAHAVENRQHGAWITVLRRKDDGRCIVHGGDALFIGSAIQKLHVGYYSHDEIRMPCEPSQMNAWLVSYIKIVGTRLGNDALARDTIAALPPRKVD